MKKVFSKHNILRIVAILTLFGTLLPILAACGGSTGGGVSGGNSVVPGTLLSASSYNKNRNVVKTAKEMDDCEYELQASYRSGNYYVFQFYLGCVEFVPLQEVDCWYWNANSEYEKTLTTQSTTTEEIKTASSDMISDTTYDSWTGVSNIDISIGTEASVEMGIASAKMTAELNVGYSHTRHKGNDVTKTASYSYENAASNSQTSIKSETYKFDTTCPAGWYRLVYMGCFDIFTMVVVDLRDNTYSIYNTSYLYRVGSCLDYCEDSKFPSNSEKDLQFDISYLDDLVIPEDEQGQGPSQDAYDIIYDSSSEQPLQDVIQGGLDSGKAVISLDCKNISDAAFNDVTLTIPNTVKEFTIAGEIGKTYNNINVAVDGSQTERELTLNLVNFNSTGSISAGEGARTSLTLNCSGDNELRATLTEGAIYGFDNVTVSGIGNLKVYGKDGADSTTTGANGNNGGVGISVDYGNLIIDMDGSIYVYGGAGGNGAKGKDQSLGSGGDAPSTQTTAGGNGGNGGSAVTVDFLTISDISNVIFVGGNGGDGGRGGDVTGTGSYSDYADLPDGGAGGKGGNGGTPINADSAITITQTSYFKAQYGNGGIGGTGGDGGDAGWPKNGIYPDGRGHGGTGGAGGAGYNGGIGGIGGNGGSSFTNYSTGAFWSKKDQIGTTGDGGYGNNGGNALASMICQNGKISYEYGTVGNGSYGGACGEQSGASNGKTVKWGTDRSSIRSEDGVQVETVYNVSFTN